MPLLLVRKCVWREIDWWYENERWGESGGYVELVHNLDRLSPSEHISVI